MRTLKIGLGALLLTAATACTVSTYEPGYRYHYYSYGPPTYYSYYSY